MKFQIPNRMNLNQIKDQMKVENYNAIKWLETKEECKEKTYLINYLKEINKKI